MYFEATYYKRESNTWSPIGIISINSRKISSFTDIIDVDEEIRYMDSGRFIPIRANGLTRIFVGHSVFVINKTVAELKTLLA